MVCSICFWWLWFILVMVLFISNLLLKYMNHTRIYIGSNNETGILDIDGIKGVLRGLEGYTLIRAEGYWKGRIEDIAIIEIFGNYNLGIIPELKRVCEQESIMVVESINKVTF